jgi:hypothetical protein
VSAVEKAAPASSSQHTSAHVRGTAGAWGTVILLLVASICFGFAVPMTSWALAIIGIVLGALGVALGRISHLMEQFY